MKNKKLLNAVLAGSLTLGSLLGFGASASAASGTNAAAAAKQYIGYNIDGHSSGYFISYIFNKQGIHLSSNLTDLSHQGKLITNKASLKPGDVVFFGTSPSKLLAAGIYTGNNNVVVAYEPYKKVKTISLTSSVAKTYYLGAKRLDLTTESTTTKPVSKPAGQAALAQKVIKAGEHYLGTPYEYGSNRSNTSTFDCSDFVRQAFKDGAGITLPSDSRQQGDYVREHSKITTDWHNLKPGDLMFFMGYRGYKQSDYKGINLSNQKIEHVAIYLGDGKILHTYSKQSGGVRIDSVADTHWEYRFMFGGSAL